jgi:hypothetical protein
LPRPVRGDIDMSSDRKERTDPDAEKDAAGGSRRDFIVRVLVGAIVAPILMFLALTIFSEGSLDEPPPPERAEPFRIVGNRIVRPDGTRFIVKGVTVPYGTFAGGDARGLGARNLASARRDFRRLEALGVNTVKILVTPRPRDPAQLSKLRTVVEFARQRGLVVEIGAAFTSFRRASTLARRLAREYRGDPYVWLQPMNEPNCPSGPPVPDCFDWVLWQKQQRSIIRAIRAEGMRSPVVVNTPNYSADLSKIDSYPLGDDSIIWGVHRFANFKLNFTERERVDERRSWAGRTLERAVIVDMVGSRSSPEFRPLSPWLTGFLTFVRDWVRDDEGSGAIGFVWRWYGANTMTSSSGRLTPWGRLFRRQYLQQVPGRA